MKTLAALFLLTGSVFAGMHGYNACYPASSMGLDNLKSSPIGLHIDSTWDVESAEMSRNSFRDGYLVSSDEWGRWPITRVGDSLAMSSVSGLPLETAVLSQDRILRKRQGGSVLISAVYAGDTVYMRDSIPGTLILAYRDVFTVDSLVRSLWYGGQWMRVSRCVATASTCVCDGGVSSWTFFEDRIEEYHQDTLIFVHHVSVGSEVGIRHRTGLPSKRPKADFRIDGSRGAPPRAWMPSYGDGTER